MEISLRELYQLEDRENSSDISGDNSPPSTTFAASISSPKRRRSIQKKVVTVPIKNVEGSRFKGECTPPSDSWAWRKYGQKPIKGSPYPRGYYRCSSSKGCPARKQVEKSRSDPNMLIVTYSYEHNHPWPTPRNHHHNRHTTTTTTPTTTAATDTTPLCPSSSNPKIELINNNKQNNQPIIQTQSIDPSGDHTESVLVAPTDELWWFPQNQYCNYNNNHNHNQISSDRHSLLTSYNMSGGDLEIDNIFPMDQEVEDSLFADLGELPECSVVFRQPAAGGEEQLAWCGTTG